MYASRQLRKNFIVILVMGTVLLMVGCLSSPIKTYQLSGTVWGEGDRPIRRVAIHISGHDEVPETNSLGMWMAFNVSGTATVTPTLEGFVFSPSSRTVDSKNDTVDFTGTLTGLEVRDLEKTYNLYNSPVFKGSIKNVTNTTTFQNIGIEFSVYETDKRETLIGEAWQYFLAATGLEPGQTVEFEALILHVDSLEEVNHYDYTVKTYVKQKKPPQKKGAAH